MIVFILDTFLLNGTSSLFDLLLDNIIKACLYNFYKNTTTLILLAQATVGTNKNHHVKIKNAVFIDVTLIKKLQSTDIMDRDCLLNCLSTPSILTDMKLV